VTNITKKALRLEEFMAANEEDVTDFGTRRFNTLETQIASLRTQVLRMETDWDEMRDDSMPTAAFNRISTMVDDSMATADETLNKAEKFMCLRLERTRQAKEETGRREDPPPFDPPMGTTGKHNRPLPKRATQ
jgi:hypothetical protein